MNDLSTLSNDTNIAATTLSANFASLTYDRYPRIGSRGTAIRLHTDGKTTDAIKSTDENLIKIRSIGTYPYDIEFIFLGGNDYLIKLFNLLYGEPKSYTNEETGGDPKKQFDGLGTYTETKAFPNPHDASSTGILTCWLNVAPPIRTITYIDTLDNSIITAYSDYISYVNSEGHCVRSLHCIQDGKDVGNHIFLHWTYMTQHLYDIHPGINIPFQAIEDVDGMPHAFPYNLSAVYQKRWQVDLYDSFIAGILSTEILYDNSSVAFNIHLLNTYENAKFKYWKSDDPNFSQAEDFTYCTISKLTLDTAVSAIYEVLVVFKDGLDTDPATGEPKAFLSNWYEIGSSVEEPDIPRHEHYEFNKWTPSKTLWNPVKGPMEITANYTTKNYTVTFKDGYDDTILKTSKHTCSELKEDEFPTPLPDHSAEGYAFIRWDHKPGMIIVSDITITAIYKKNSTVIFYDTIGKSIIKQYDNVKYNANVDAPTPPEYTDYVFGKWNPDSWNPITTDKTINAIYKPKITFIDNETKDLIGISVVYNGDTVNPPSVPDHSSSGKEFWKWNPNETEWNPAQYPLSVYAFYRLTSNYTVTFIDNYNGITCDTLLVLSGDAAKEPALPIHTAYAAIKWNPSTSCVTSDITATPIYAEIPEIVGNFEIDNIVDIKAVQNSLHNIFSWIPGQRILYPEFGSNLRKLLYEGITAQNSLNIIAEIKYTINTWEPRITVNDIYDASTTDDHNNNQIHLIVVYSIPTLSDQKYQYDYVLNMTSF